MNIKNCFLTLISTVFVFSHLTATQSELCRLAQQFQTDKYSAHNYTVIYNKYFKNLKDTPIKFLEIGFAVGSSARMWDSYFSHEDTSLHFIDINQDCYSYTQNLSKRTNLHLVDQGNEKSLLEFIGKVQGNFDIIIDDGGHFMNQQITSFKTLFPYVKSGGMYIIEDLHTSYWKQYGSEGGVYNPKASSNSCIRFLNFLIDELNYCGAYTGYADSNLCPKTIKDTFNIYQKDIDSIHFYCSMCFIFKK